ncbi:MAG: hypothetical protein MUD14_29780 [Hydrococcus sp. Prado102]|jgi:hypothetical protein|nr:hypothetical protein [Hydrococcus sp. Prado102]
MERWSQKQIEAERMRDVLLLLEHLLHNEKTTAKLIINCLYDIGSVNLIDKKISNRSLNKMMKAIAKVSKPVFSIIALRWLQKNCPQLLATWLHSQVSFRKVQAKKELAYVRENLPIEPKTLNPNPEIKRLRSQVRLLAGTSVVATVAFLGSAIAWISYNPTSDLLLNQTLSKPVAIEKFENATKE